MEFKDRFKQLRLNTGLNQKEFVADFNKKYHFSFGTPSISMYENGKRVPELDALTAFADYFDVSTDYLLGRSDVKKDNEIDEDKIFTLAAHHSGENKELSEEDMEAIKLAIKIALGKK